ncbi:hypothetical protein T02_10252 [Trichinella nativa]|uniref:Uncharacterized protein n=1 Tax=Trichinella nativa TaxID=6335 RepID=A0A0V1LC47_9BILA|nr:hypothetical protein T02_10252 [Trichinella nativa]
MHNERTSEPTYARTLVTRETTAPTSLSHCGGLLSRVDDRYCPTLAVSGDCDAASLSSLGVVTNAAFSSCVVSAVIVSPLVFFPVIRSFLHCDVPQQLHSVFSTGLCVCATDDRLLFVLGRTVGLSDSQRSMVSRAARSTVASHTA